GYGPTTGSAFQRGALFTRAMPLANRLVLSATYYLLTVGREANSQLRFVEPLLNRFRQFWLGPRYLSPNGDRHDSPYHKRCGAARKVKVHGNKLPGSPAGRIGGGGSR